MNEVTPDQVCFIGCRQRFPLFRIAGNVHCALDGMVPVAYPSGQWTRRPLAKLEPGLVRGIIALKSGTPKCWSIFSASKRIECRGLLNRCDGPKQSPGNGAHRVDIPQPAQVGCVGRSTCVAENPS